MKMILVIVIFLAPVFAQGKDRKPASFKSVGHDNLVCKSKVEAVIRSITKAMGFTKSFGIEDLTPISAGKDMMGRSLSAYNTGVFIVDEGYQSNSGATVVVRSDTCKVIKVTVSIGG